MQAPIQAAEDKGQVITFYSYKGGTGRSMALANVGYLLAIRQSIGKPVLMIDWDLEAPGLHRYFGERVTRRFGTDENALELHPGLIEYLQALQLALQPHVVKGRAPESCSEAIFSSVPLSSYLIQTDVDALWLLKAGSFGSLYSTAVNTFHWEDFFKLAPWFFERLATELCRQFAYVLIDSRTGLTDVSGICTMLMPQKLVAVFTPNKQSLYGVIGLLRSAVQYRRKSNDLRPLVIFPLPSRVERAVPDLQKQWRFNTTGRFIGYQPQFQSLIAEAYGVVSPSLSDYFDAVLIPHVPEYAYGEEVAAMQQSASDVSSSALNYQLFLERLLRPTAPWQDPRALQIQELETTFARKAEEVYARMPPEQQNIAHRIFERLVRLARPDEGSAHSCVAAQRADLPEDSTSVINEFVQAGLIAVADSEASATLRIAQEDLLKEWPRLRQWLEQDRIFLLWRQSLRAAIAASDQSKRQLSYLLSGAQLLEAESYLTSRPGDLISSEREFIQASRTQYNSSLAVSLASYATHELLRQVTNDGLQRAVLLAAESLRRAHTLEGDQALRLGMSKLAKLIFTFDHQDEITGVLVSHSGRYAATCDATNLIRIWNTQTGRSILTDRIAASVQDWKFSPNDGYFGLLIVGIGLRVFSLGETQATVLLDLPASIGSFALSDTLLATSAKTGFQVTSLVTYGITMMTDNPSVKSMAFLDGDKGLAVGSATGQAILYPFAPPDPRITIELGEPVREIIAKNIAVAVSETRIVAYDFNGEQSRIEGLHANAFTERIAVCRDDRGLAIRELLSQRPPARIRAGSKWNSLTLSEDSTVLAIAESENMARIFDIPTELETRRAIHDGSVMQVSLDAKATRMATRAKFQNRAYFWDIANHPPGLAFQAGSFVWDVCFDSTGTRLATATSSGEARIYDVASRLLPLTLGKGPSGVTAVAFSPDNRLLATATGPDRVSLWNAETGELIFFLTHQGAVAVAFSPQGNFLATSGRDGDAIFWDLRTNTEVFRVHHPDSVWQTVFAPYGFSAATACEDGTIRIIDVNLCKVRSEFFHSSPVRAVAFIDDVTVASAGLDGSVRSYSLFRNSPDSTYSGRGELTSVALSPDRQYIAAGSAEGVALIWRIDNTELVAEIPHPDLVNWVAFSPDGKYLATACADGFARACLWRPQDLITAASTQAGRTLTPDEWTKYIPEEPPPSANAIA